MGRHFDFRGFQPFSRRRLSGRARFNPASLFAGGEQGCFGSAYDGLYTDTARTTPAVPDDAVAAAADFSGRGNHLAESILGNRPILRASGALRWLEFDGISDKLGGVTVNFAGTDEITMMLAMRKEGADTVVNQQVFGTGAGGSNNGTFNLAAPGGGTRRLGLISRGTANGEALTASTAYNSPLTLVAGGRAKIGTPRTELWVDGAGIVSNTASQGSGTYASSALRLGARGDGAGNWFSGRTYAWLIIGRWLTNAEMAALSGWMAERAGL
jgi:hypothetical protein